MKIIGIICEYNPFHNGHLYHIQTVLKHHPGAILILVLNGYFLERGEISILSKEDKTKIALENGVNIVLELPVVFGTQSADIFAEKSIEVLKNMLVTDIYFGSESNDIKLLEKIAFTQLNDMDYQKNVKEKMKLGVNYPTALATSFNIDEVINQPNDLLGISYAKAVFKNNWNISLHTILRTNEYHDTLSNDLIVSASNIRDKIKNNTDIHSFLPIESFNCIKTIEEEDFFLLLKYKIITDLDLRRYLGVTEGIESRLLKNIYKSETMSEFINHIKTKRYTYNRIRRMLFHILIGLTKDFVKNASLEYTRVLGLDNNGKVYLNQIRHEILLPTSVLFSSKIWEYEKKAAFLYTELTNCNVLNFEIRNCPIIKKEN